MTQNHSLCSDRMLVAAFMHHDDTHALNTLICRYKDKLYTSILLLVRDRHVADNVFQDVFIRIIENLRKGQYKHRSKFLPWAVRIARNLCIDHFRKVKRTPRITTSDDRDIFEALNFSEANSDKRILTNERNVAVHKMIDMLSDEQREVVILRHYADLSFKEIALLTKCSINTALGRMRYALTNLRKIMAAANAV